MTHTNKVIVITGAAGNLGSAVAKKFDHPSNRIALIDLNEERLEEVKNTLQCEAASFPVNLMDITAVSQTVKDIIEKFENIDVLANVAGGFTMGPFLHDTPEKDWNFMFDLNARSVFNMCHAIIPHMRNQGSGRVINIAARAAKEGKAKMGPYCASKAAVITLTETLSAENRMNNINVNCILPGTIDTPQNRQDMPDANFDHWVPPEAIAEVIAFLASDAAVAVSGAAIPVYGKS